MKTFYNVVNSIICCAKEACAWIVLDIEWVQFVLQNCENWRTIGLNRAKKEQIKKQRNIVLFTSDVMQKKYV